MITVGLVLAGLSLLLIIIDPTGRIYQQAPYPPLLMLVTSIMLIIIALSSDRTLIRSLSAMVEDNGGSLNIKIIFKEPVSGFLQVGEISAVEFVRDESVSTSYVIQSESEHSFHSTSTLSAKITGKPASGLVTGSVERATGVFRCPGMKISILNGPELYVAWLRPASTSLNIRIEKPNLFSVGAQCSLSYSSSGGINYLLSSSERSNFLFPSRVVLKLLRVLSSGPLNLKHEEVVAEVKGGEVGTGVWHPRSYVGEDVLIVFNGLRRVGEILYALGSREFVVDPAPGVTYSFVLERKRSKLRSERDVAYITINSSGEKEENE